MKNINTTPILIRALSFPVRITIHGVHKIFPHNRQCGEIILAVCVILLGSWIATIHPTVVPHFVWDAFAWFVHGLGVAPIAEHLATVIVTE